jgi:arylsulfatase A-like enzyme
VLGLALASLPAIPNGPIATGVTQSSPNFVVVVTDDQRWDTIGRCLNGFDGADLAAGANACMPALQQRLVANGTTFLGGYVPTSLCCPSRASILSGQFARHTGVLNNSGPTSIPAFRDASTLATWLDADGYRTGLFGKYMNGYGEPGPIPPNYVPPGWDAWYGVSRDASRYTNYSLVQKDPGGTPTTVSYLGGNTAPTPCASGVVYMTDHLCRRALDFLAADATSPFFLYFSPLSPHEPYTAPSRYTGIYAGVTPPTYPNFNAAPSPNPPRWMRTTPYPPATVDQLRTDFRNMLAANRAVDDAIEQLWTRLANDGRLDETVWIFLSDNGVAQGEHRYTGKPCEYEECHRVPFVVACPPDICEGAVGGQVDAQHLALNIDIAPTIAELAGVAPQHRLDGASLVPFLSGETPPWRTAVPLEDHGTGTIVQAPLGVVSREADGHVYKLVSFQTKPGFELFDLTADPWELSNLYANPAYASVRASLTARMNDIQTPPTMTLNGPSGNVAASDVTYTWTASQTAQVECRLDGGAFAACGSGLSGTVNLVDLSLASHTFELRGFDVDNNPSTTLTRTFTVTADTTPPPPPTIDARPPDPSGPDVQFAFSGAAGVTFACALDGGPSTACTSPWSLAALAPGVHTFAVRAADAAGNLSTPATYSWTVLDLAPEPPAITLAPPDPGAPDAAFAFVHPEPGVTFECSLDDAPPQACTSPIGYADLAEGPHDFDVWAIDTGGNRSDVASVAWTVDDHPTAPTIDAAPPPVSGPDVSFAFSSDAPAATFECSLDGSGFAPCSSPSSFEDLGDGPHRFLVRSVDGADASGSAAGDWVVDSIAPGTPLLLQTPSDPTNDPNATFVFTGDGDTAGFECSLDGSAFQACASPAGYPSLADGPHGFEVRAVDGAGNPSAPASFSWTVDTMAPPPPVFTEVPPDPGGATATFAFEDGEPGAALACSLDGAVPSPCSTPQTYVGLGSGPHTFSVVARDAAGNDSPPATYAWTVSTPVLAVSTAGDGTGTVTSSPAGIACPGDCSEAFAYGTVVTLTAVPTGSSTFSGWSGDCAGTGACQLTMNLAHAATATFATPPVTQVSPSSTTLVQGAVQSGTAASLTADDDAYFVVGSTTKGTRTAGWYGTFTGISNGATSLAATYKGKSSATCTQAIAMWRWTDSTWVQLDSRSVGTTEIQVSNLTPPGTLADFVSGTTGDGEVRVRISCSTGTATFSLSGDLLRLTV